MCAKSEILATRTNPPPPEKRIFVFFGKPWEQKEKDTLLETEVFAMITATAWVPRGFSARFPERYEFDDKEYDRIAALARIQLEDAKEDLEEAQDEDSNGTKSNGGATAEAKDEDMKEADDER